MSNVAWRIRDYSDEYSTFTVEGVDLSAANFTAQVALYTALQTSLDGIILGTIAARQVVASQVNVNDVRPASAFAQRENKALVSYRNDITGELRRAEIPTPDLALTIAGTDLFDLTLAAVIAFVTDFEAYVNIGGQTWTVEEIRYVARNI